MNKEIVKQNQEIRNTFVSSQEVKLLNLSDITLVEPIHINAKCNLSKRVSKLRNKNITQLNKPIIVKEESNGKYSLIMGYSGYMVASSLGHTKVPCVIINEKRKELTNKLGFKSPRLANGSDKFMPICKIIVPTEFKWVRKEKVDKCIEYFKQNGCFDKPVIIKDNGLCVDGFSRLMAAKRLNLSKIAVKIA